MDTSASSLTRRIQQLYVLVEDGDRRALQPVGLTPTQFNLLQAVATAPHGGMRVTQLASALLCTRGNATRLVTRLSDAGLLTTRGDAQDQRLRLVALSPTGRRRLRDATDRVDAANKRRLASMTPDDLRAAHHLVQRLTGAIQQDLDRASSGTPGFDPRGIQDVRA